MPHEPTAECATMHCAHHNEDEPGPGYLACLECFHLYETEADLQAAYVDASVAIDPAVSRAAPHVSKILFCPLCGHDF